MSDLKQKYLLCREITDDIIEILRDGDRFENIDKHMADMINCDFNNSNLLPKSCTLEDFPAIQCGFIVYPDKIVFGVYFLPFDDSEYIIERMNKELPFLIEPIDPDSFSIPVNLTIVDKLGMYILMKTKDRLWRKMILKMQLDKFLRNQGDKIISKIWEVVLNVAI